MGIRYRKKIKIAPGVNLNISKKRISSVSIGKKGATMNINKSDSQATFGIPGSGISYTTKRSKRGNNESKNASNAKISSASNVSIGQNQVTLEQIINNKDHAIAMMQVINYAYDPYLEKKDVYSI